MKISKFLSLLIVAAFFFACNNETSVNNAELKNFEPLIVPGWKTLSFRDYSIQYPEATYGEKESDLMGSEFILLKRSNSADQSILAGVNLFKHPMEGGQELTDEVLDVVVQQSKMKATNLKIIEKNSFMYNDKKAYNLIYTGIVNNQKLKIAQKYIYHKKVIYELTFGCLEETFDEFYKDGSKIMNTFTLLN